MRAVSLRPGRLQHVWPLLAGTFGGNTNWRQAQAFGGSINKNYASIAMAMTCLSATSGCQSAATPDEEVREGGSPNVPAIHAIMHWERIENGKNAQREAYLRIIEDCKAAGWPTQELSAEQIRKLDTGKVEIWSDARGAYGRQTGWKFKMEGPGPESGGKGVCRMTLDETIDEGDDDYTGDDWSDVAVDQAEVASMARIKGFERVGAAQVGGQPCTRWRSKDYEVCSWSGGLDTGIEDGPADALCVIGHGPTSYLNPIPLESKQGSQGMGCNLQLQSMTVSKGLLPEVARALGATHTEE